MTADIRFVLDGEVVTLPAPDPQATVLDLLRYRLRRTGSKEGCAEGDCGACTVLLGETADDAVAWRAVNACILFAPMLDGRALLTVESLGGDHPVQREMVAHHGSQCGFCTPGIVMSLYARSIGASGADGTAGDLLSGNLCRCTGYGPILAAADAIPAAPRDDAATLAALRTIAPQTEGQGWHAPRTTAELATLYAANPDARLVAGGTDVGLWVTKQHRALGPIIFLGHVADLRNIEETPAGLTLGAGVRYADAHAPLARLDPALGALVMRIGGAQVRNAGTIGGNIANASPIGDMPPALIALGAMLTLRRGDDRRTIPLEDFFLAYGRQDRQPGEFVERVHIPRPAPDTLIRITKLSKRFDSDISAICAAIVLRIADGRIATARLAFGGMAGIPARAPATEAALTGAAWSEATLDRAATALAEDFRPLDDLRGSAAYRLRAAGNLLRRLWHEGHEPVSVLDLTDG